MTPTPLARLLQWSEVYLQTDMRYLMRSGFWINLNVVVISFFSLGLAVAFANLIPAETYGVYQYLLSFGSIIGALTLTGMNYAVTQAVARGNEGVFRASLKMQLRWGVIPFIISLGIAGYYVLQGNYEFGYGIAAIGLATPLIYAFNTYIAFLNGKQAFRQTFWYGLVLNVGYYGGLLAAIVFFREALPILLVGLVVQTLLTFGLCVHTLRTYRPKQLTETESLAYGKHLSFMYIPTLVIRQLDNVLVFQVLGPVQLAVYSFASTIPERLAGFFKFIFTAALPRFSARTKDEVGASLFSKMGWLTLAGLVAAAGYALIAPTLFELLLPRYMEAVPYTQAYALIMAASASNLSISALIAHNLKRELYLFYTITPFVGFALQVVLLLTYGLWGLVIGRVLVTFLDTIVSSWLFYRTSATS